MALLVVLFGTPVVADVIAGDDGRDDPAPQWVAEARVDEITESLRRNGALRDRPRSPVSGDDGVLFRAVLPDGVMVSLEEDGRVVYVLDTTVTSSTEDYESLRLDGEGTTRVRALVFDALLEPDEETGVSVFHGGGRVNPAPASLGPRLADLSWLGQHVVEPLGPWVPEELSIEAHPPLPAPPSPLGADAPFAPWPLDVRVDELPHRVVDHPYGERRAICLAGEEAARLFTLLTGVNHAYLRVDDGQRWELNVTVHSPGYRLHGSACEVRS